MSKLTYETVLDQALALSPEDRARLINQLAASEASEVFAAVRAEGIPLPFITFIPEGPIENGARVINF